MAPRGWILAVVVGLCASCVETAPPPSSSSNVLPGSVPPPSTSPAPANPAPTVRASAPSISITGFPDAVTSVAWSPDGTRLATAVERVGEQSSGAVAGKVWLWRSDGTLLGRLTGPRAGMTALAWSPDGALLAAGSLDGSVRLWRLDQTVAATLHPGAGQVLSLAWSPAGQALAVGLIRSPTDNTAEIWSRAGVLKATLHTAYSGGKFYHAAWSPDGRFLVTGATDYALWTYDTTGTATASWQADSGVTAIAWRPDSSALICGNQGFTPTGTAAGGLAGVGAVDDLVWSPDGTMVAASSNEATVAVFDASLGLRFLLTPATAASGTIGSHRLDWAPNGRLLAVGYDDAEARIWTVGP